MDAIQPLDSEMDDVIRFLNKHLRPDTSWSIKEEYPLVFDSKNSGNVRIIKDAEKILAHAVSKYLLIKTPVGIFKVAAIGSVVTDPKFRNQGHSQKVLEASLEAAKTHGCDFAILWTDIYDFYRKLGFELSGSEIGMKIDSSFSYLNEEQLRIESTSNVSSEALLKVYNKHLVGTIRIPADIQSYLKIPNMKLYTAWDSKNQLRSYAALGKGADLNGYVHEWGGGVSDLLTMFQHIQRVENRTLTVISPAHSQNLIRQMETAGASVNNGFLGMIKILDTKNLFFKMKRHTRSRGYDKFVMEKRNGEYYFGNGEAIFKTSCERDIVKLLFGPQRPSDLFKFDPDTEKVLNDVLPVPMWIWGWDSI